MSIKGILAAAALLAAPAILTAPAAAADYRADRHYSGDRDGGSRYDRDDDRGRYSRHVDRRVVIVREPRRYGYGRPWWKKNRYWADRRGYWARPRHDRRDW